MIYALRMALRQFRLHPAFALITVLVLGLGTGAATVVYTIVDSVVLRPLPYRAPDELVKFWDTNTEKGLRHDPFSPVTFMDYKALPVFDDAAAWWRPDVNLVDPGLDPVRVKTIEASAQPLLGARRRNPDRARASPGGGPFFSNDLIAVISDRLWRTRYNADPGSHRQALEPQWHGLSQSPASCRPGFRFPDDVDVWQRLQWDLTQHSRSAHFMEGVARLADGVSLEQARAAPARSRRPARHRVRGQQQGLGVRHRAPARRSARLLPPGALRAVRRRRTALRHRLPERGVAAADAGAVARARDRGPDGARRRAAPDRDAAAGGEPRPVGRRRGRGPAGRARRAAGRSSRSRRSKCRAWRRPRSTGACWPGPRPGRRP